MGYTKKQIIVDAFNQIGITDLSFEVDSEELTAALRMLDRMITSWEVEGVYLQYPLPASPEESDIDQESNIQDFAIEAVVYNLACKIAYTKGRDLSNDYKNEASTLFKRIKNYAKTPPIIQLDRRLPLGQGNRIYDGRYYRFVRQNQIQFMTNNTLLEL